MFKQKLILLFILFFGIDINPHGFGQSTLISLANYHYQSIDNLCAYTRTKSKYPSVLTYKEKTHEYTKHSIKSLATSKVNCYFAIGFDNNATSVDITCTPDQEFYSITACTWVPAYQLRVGDELLSKNNTVAAITHIEFINKPIDVFIVEVKKTHTFFVGRHAVLTHNIILPLGIGMSVPFGSVAGGTIGGFFGPITCTVGILAGTVIGYVIKIFNDDKISQYKLPQFDVSYIGNYRNSMNRIENKNNEGAQAPGMPTADDGYEPPKKWDGKKVKHGGSYGWPDKKGRVWIPSGPNGHGGPHWDVEYPKKNDHDNVYPGGKIRSKRK